MSDLRTAPSAATSRLSPPRAWPVAPWRLAVWVACLVLAAAAAVLTWTEQRAGDAQAVDAELMLRVAQRWAEAQAHAAATAADDTPRAAAGPAAQPTPMALEADTARALALIDYQHRREPSRAPAIGGARDAWAEAAERWAARWRERGAAADRGARLRADAAAMAEASQRLMQVLRERAEARAAAAGSGARPGVLLALASAGLLLLGLRPANGSISQRSSAPDGGAEPPVPLPRAPGLAPQLERLVDEAALRAQAQGSDASLPRLLLALQVDAPAALLAEIAPGARLELERQIVRRLHVHLGDGDAVAVGEIGDDRLEVLVLLLPPRTLQPGLVEDLFDDIADAYTVHDHPVRPPMRMGVRELDGSSADAAAAMHEARVACAQASPGGITRYSADLGERAALQATLARQLDAALGSGELQVVYRPVRAADGGARLLGCRAAWRWRHPERGELADGDVQHLALLAGRALELQRALQRGALACWAGWRRDGHVPPDARIGVPCTLDADAAESVRGLLDEAALPGTAVELLVDEAGVDAASAAPRVAALRGLGAAVTLQGLAQASASLAALPQYGASRVLVARRFVEQLPHHDPHRLLVQAVVSLAATHGLSVHAEGVETAPQRDALVALGVAAIEGAQAGLPADAAHPPPPEAPGPMPATYG